MKALKFFSWEVQLGKQWSDLFLMEKLGKGKSQVFDSVMTLRRQRKDGRCSKSLMESNT